MLKVWRRYYSRWQWPHLSELGVMVEINHHSDANSKAQYHSLPIDQVDDKCTKRVGGISPHTMKTW